MRVYQQNVHTPVFQVADNEFVLETNVASGWLKLYDPEGKAIGLAHSNSYDSCSKLRSRFADLHGEGDVNIIPGERIRESFNPSQVRSVLQKEKNIEVVDGEGGYMEHKEFIKYSDARAQEAKGLAFRALEGQLPAGYAVSDDPKRMYVNALFCIRPEEIVKGSVALYFFHGLSYKNSKADDGSVMATPGEENVRFSANIFNGKAWENHEEWGVDGKVKSMLFGKNDMVSAVHDAVGMMLGQEPMVKLEWVKDVHDAEKQYLYCDEEKRGAVWKTGCCWGSTAAIVSEGLGSAKVSVESQVVAENVARHRERLKVMEEKSVVGAGVPPPGWEFVDNEWDDPFNPWGDKDLQSAFEKRLRDDGGVVCDLTILYGSGFYAAAHGGVIMQERVTTKEAAAGIAMEWGRANGYCGGREVVELDGGVVGAAAVVPGVKSVAGMVGAKGVSRREYLESRVYNKGGGTSLTGKEDGELGGLQEGVEIAWKMTKDEWHDQERNLDAVVLRRKMAHLPEADKPTHPDMVHRESVVKAIAEGREVAAEVMKDYGDLVKGVEKQEEVVSFRQEITMALLSKSYMGEIVADKDADHVVQHIGKNIFVAHVSDKLDRVPVPGEKVIIKYDENGLGKVVPRKQKEKSAELVR